MKSKGYKIVVCVLIVVVAVLGGLAAIKAFAPNAPSVSAPTAADRPVPEGAMKDTTVGPSPSGGYDVATPKGDAA